MVHSEDNAFKTLKAARVSVHSSDPYAVSALKKCLVSLTYFYLKWPKLKVIQLKGFKLKEYYDARLWRGKKGPID